MDIESFKKRKKPKNKSKLFDFKSEILNLHLENYSLVSIQEFLSHNGVKTTFQNLSKYIKKIKNSTGNSEELPKTRIEKPKEPKKEDLKIEEKKSTISINEIKQNEKEKPTEAGGIQFLKLQKIGKDTDIKDAPDWAK